ncbi:Reverse_transcriptase/endonuclease [Hexamita inflata]|uniref:Putative n=1 Tax=Hexamita inflata TaxID=28002 RepID=A0AA86UM89_9EUKA|nr:Reverse transcriptase/endonuclease [Hexamita inflata]
MILAVFSSCLKTRLMQQIKIHDHQFCFKSGGITHALARVESFKAQGKTLTLADCTNAYQAIDQNALIHSLQLNGVNSLFVEYYRTYLDTRSCKYADKITSGCPAGSSTSSMAFAGALTDVITAMEAKGYQLTVFADDIQISHDQNVDKDVVLQELAALLQPLGLELSLNKCSSTQDGGEITFLGQTFSQSSTVSLAERMTAKIDKCLKVLDASPITNHQKYLLLRSVVLPKVNYAPLVDFAPKIPQDGFGNQYGLIDQKVFKYASDLFAVKDLSETEQADFFTNSASKGGLEMVVPSLYYDFMQAQQKAVLAGKCCIFFLQNASFIKMNSASEMNVVYSHNYQEKLQTQNQVNCLQIKSIVQLHVKNCYFQLNFGFNQIRILTFFYSTFFTSNNRFKYNFKLKLFQKYFKTAASSFEIIKLAMY